MKKIRFFAGILISLLFLYLALKNIDFKIIAAGLKNIDIRYLALSFISLVINLLCRSYLWKHILHSERDVRYRHSFESLLIGYMGNNILPFRMGEVMRAYAMGKKEGISGTQSLASIVLERLFDLFTLLLFFFVLILFMPLENWIILSGILVFIFFILALIFLYLIGSDFRGLPSSLYQRVIQYVPDRFIETISGNVQAFVKGIKLIRNMNQVLSLVFLSILTWVFGAAILYYGLKAFHLELPITATILLVVVVNLGILIPSSPGYIGVFQYLCIVSLSFFGVSKEIALAYSFVVHMIQYIPITLLGWFYFMQMHIVSYHRLKVELGMLPRRNGK